MNSIIIQEKPDWKIAPEDAINLPRENYIVIKLPEEEQPKLSLTLYSPQGARKDTPTRFRVVNAGPAAQYYDGKTVVEGTPRAEIGDIVLAFITNIIHLAHLGPDVYFLPEMNILYVEPRKECTNK